MLFYSVIAFELKFLHPRSLLMPLERRLYFYHLNIFETPKVYEEESRYMQPTSYKQVKRCIIYRDTSIINTKESLSSRTSSFLQCCPVALWINQKTLTKIPYSTNLHTYIQFRLLGPLGATWEVSEPSWASWRSLRKFCTFEDTISTP